MNHVISHDSERLSFKDTLAACIDKLEGLDNKRILDGLGEFLTTSQKNWAKAKLKSETLFLLRIMHSN